MGATEACTSPCSEFTGGSIAPWCFRGGVYDPIFSTVISITLCFRGASMMARSWYSLMLPWRFRGTSMMPAWVFRGAFMVRPWGCRGSSMGAYVGLGLLWCFYRTPVVEFPWCLHVAYMVLLWWFTSMVFL